MEKKTIGGFIAALRKANGMTQRELAERLNVSDKTVSRWECDEGNPDLATIPVLAEIFGVTCDELLRGERVSPENRGAVPQSTPKGEKERKRLLELSRFRFRNRTVLAMSVALAGFLVALVCNFALLKSSYGFYLALPFYIASAIVQSLVRSSALVSVYDAEAQDDEVGKFRYQVFLGSRRCYSLAFLLLAVTMPLMTNGDSFYGLTLDTWLVYGASWLLLALPGVFILCQVLTAHFLKKNCFALAEELQKKELHNNRLKSACALLLAAMVFVTCLGHAHLELRANQELNRSGLTFDSYEDAKAYLEKEVTVYLGSDGFYMAPIAQEPNMAPGMSQEELEDMVHTYDLEHEGKVLFTYVLRNHSVANVFPSDTADGLPIHVQLYEDLMQSVTLSKVPAAILLLLETLGTAWLYRKKHL